MNLPGEMAWPPKVNASSWARVMAPPDWSVMRSI